MKKLGLIGGIGPESTLLYYKKITERVYKRENLFPPLLIESLDVHRVLSYCGQKDYAGLTAYLDKGITNLVAGGAQVVAMTGNTPHIVFDELSEKSPVPLVNSVAVTAHYVAEKRLKRPLFSIWGIGIGKDRGCFQNILETAPIVCLGGVGIGLWQIRKHTAE